MADEIIGSVGVQIEADASDLQGQYDAAVAQSEDAASRIAAAFESLVGIGEALAITEGLKEFGEEALSTFATVQSVTIGLTELTKSASDANEIIESIKNLAATEPFAFPDLAPAVQKMVALGVAADQIPKTLQAAADAASATGNSFDAVAGSIDRVTLSGNLNQRQLVQLGLSIKDVSDAMGVTEVQAKALFASLDQAQRIDVIDQALTKFAGSAIAQAQGIGGAWQIFQNQFEEVMLGVGTALAPAASAILKFGEEALSIAQEAIDAFNKLPEPIRDVSGAIVIATAAIAPLFAAVGLLGQGIIGAQAALGLFSTALESLGLKAATAATAEGVAATAITAQGAASTVAAVETEALAVAETSVAEGSSIAAIQLGLFGEEIAATTVYTTSAVTQMGLFTEETGSIAVGAEAAGLGISAMGVAATTAGGAIVALISFNIGKWAVDNVPGVASLGQALNDAFDHLPGYTVGIQAWRDALGVTTPEVRSEAEEIKNLQTQLDAAGRSVDQNGRSNEDYITVLREVRTEIGATTTATDGYGLALDALLKKHQDLGVELQTAIGVLAVAKQRFDDGAISSAQFAEAQKNVEDVEKRLNALNPVYADTIGGITEAYNKQENQINTLQNTIGQLLAVTNRTQQQDDILSEATTKLTGLLKQQADAHGLVTAAAQGQGKAYDSLTTSADALLAKEQAVDISVQNSKAVLDQLTASTDNSAVHQRAVTDALNQYVTALQKSGASMSDVITLTVNGVDVVTTLGDAVNKVKQGQGDWNSVMVNGVSILRDHAAAVTTTKTAVDSLGSSYDNSSAILAKFNQATQTALTNSQTAIGYYSSYVGALQHVDDVTNAMVDNTSKFAATVNDVSGELQATVDNASVFANSIDHIGTSAINASNDLKGLVNAVDSVSMSLSEADKDMQAFTAGTEGALGSTTALTYAASLLADQMSGLTAFAGSGGIINENSSPDTSYQLWQLQHAAGDPQAAGGTISITPKADDLSTALTKVSTSATTATTSLQSLVSTVGLSAGLATGGGTVTSSIGALVSTATDLTGAVADATSAQQQYVDGLGNVYNSYQALVDAIKANPLLAGPAQAVGANANGSGPSAGPAQAYKDALGNVYSTYADLQAAIAKNPLLAGAAQSRTQIQPTQTGQTFSLGGQQVSQSVYENSLPSGATAFGGSAFAPFPSAISNTGNNQGFGTGVPSNQQQPINPQGNGQVNIIMNYPQVTSQSNATQLMSQVVTMLRTVPGLKL